MQPNTTFTNSFYGGQQLNASNVLFTNGLIDPWHLLSITEDLPAPSQVTAVTYEAGHCATLTGMQNLTRVF
jgi:thymus-specific serine protease